MSDAIDMVIEPRTRPVGSGSVRRLLPYRKRRMVGPFIFTDLIGPETLEPGQGTDIDAHPHIGLSTITYLFAGRMVHRDSTGAVQAIEPGAVNWMTAGAGVTHTERSHADDRPVKTAMSGLQTWVALPLGAEDTEPAFEHLGAAEVPVLEFGDSSVRLAVGTGWGSESPVVGSSELILADVTLEAGAPVRIEADHPERAVLAVHGDVRIGDRSLAEGAMALLAPGPVSLSGSGAAVVLGGAPVGERHIWWNFVHSDPERIDQAKHEWTEQRFPTVPDDHDNWVRLPS